MLRIRFKPESDGKDTDVNKADINKADVNKEDAAQELRLKIKPEDLGEKDNPDVPDKTEETPGGAATGEEDNEKEPGEAETGEENNKKELGEAETGEEDNKKEPDKAATEIEDSEKMPAETSACKRKRRSKEGVPEEAAKKGKLSRRKKASSVLAEPVEKKPMKRWKKITLIIGAVLLAIIMTFAFSIWREYTRTESTPGKKVEVVIEKGSTTREVAEELKEAGVIRYETAFLMKIYFSDNRGKLRYGVFQLNDGMCLNDVIDILVTGGAQKKEESFTIPEGYSIAMTAQKLEKEGVMSEEEFLNAVTDAAADFQYADVMPKPEQVFYQLEGYIFPDTYYLSEDMTGEELVQKILNEFIAKFDKERQDAAAALGMSVEEVLIRASLIQKETERPEEYARIAGVINNRLEQNMKLQFDSTVVYALSKGLYGVDRVLYSHLEVDSPYNTYKNTGLPAGPICSPSLEAIDGVLHPEENDYLYFQADQVKNDGSNLYFKTYEEHEAAAATTENPASVQENTSEAKENTVTDTQAAPDAASGQKKQ